MHVFLILFFLLLAAIVFGIIEFYLHQKRIYSIPIRIHVNGTRGKSSVTRLIGAGLSSAGIKTITKVTGTYPRLILENGTETQIYRKANANIIEQLGIVKFAAERKAEALVIECMALEPQYQGITENQMIHATAGVITNVRLDHVDIMGYTLPEIASVLGKTIPAGKVLFTSEKNNRELHDAAVKKNSKVIMSGGESISDYEMTGFKYIEHKENVALALKVCEYFGARRETALQAMYDARPDAGALIDINIQENEKQIKFFNAFAANDPQSTLLIWNKLLAENRIRGKKILLLNTRQDRLDRARQLSEMIGKDINDNADCLLLVGQSTEVVENMCVSAGFEKKKIINIGWTDAAEVYDTAFKITDTISTILGIGNIGGMGAMIVKDFELRSLAND